MNSLMEHDEPSIEKSRQSPLTMPSINPLGSSLTEPVTDTIRRDIDVIVAKLKFFFVHTDKSKEVMSNEIRNYDLWGPFVFTLFFAFFVTLRSGKSIEAMFSIIIIYICFGILGVTLNTRLLRIHLTLMQGASLIGYSLFPMNAAAVFLSFFYFLPQFLKVAVTVVAVGASVKCGYETVKCIAPEEKTLLVTYPLVLFYLGLGCFLFSC